MSLNHTPSANRLHIGIFGKRNAGKSSIINAITGQNLAIVSDIKGTTTDPVLKAMELLPLGPVVMIDTPGLDDTGELGSLRIQKSYQILNKTDVAVLVMDNTTGMTAEDREILEKIRKKKIPYILVLNKCDLDGPVSGIETLSDENEGRDCKSSSFDKENVPHTDSMSDGNGSKNSSLPADAVCISVSAKTGKNIHELKELIASVAPNAEPELPIVRDLLKPHDLVVLVVPIDKAAPKGRLILPQQQTIRDILEAGAISVVTRETELAQTLASLGQNPRLVITDSQAFEEVAKIVPEDIPLTSFSILFARHKGNLALLAQGASVLDSLEDGDTLLISEGCTHHRQCDDIGTVKLPRWITQHSGKKLNFAFTSGTIFHDNISQYRLIIHCGGCTLNEKEMKYRLLCAADQQVPITNYGIAIAHMKGILKRSLEPLGM